MLTRQIKIAYEIAAVLALFAAACLLQHINAFHMVPKTMNLACASFVLASCVIGAAYAKMKWGFKLALAGLGCIALALGVAILGEEASDFVNGALFSGVEVLIAGGVGVMKAMPKKEKSELMGLRPLSSLRIDKLQGKHKTILKTRYLIFPILSPKMIAYHDHGGELIMAESKSVKVVDIALDLANPRTVPQPNESTALETMVSINPTKFWGLMESVIDDGYHPTENIILLKDKKGKYSVKEGNRRVAILKILLGKLQYQDIPSDLTEKIATTIDSSWKKENVEVPCMIYEESEEDAADRIVSRIHAKGEPAGRDGWTAVAKFRYDRDKKRVSAPALDLLEAYIAKGKNLSPQQAERWSGDYPITVLHEALPKLSRALSQSTADFVKAYPKKNKRLLDSLLLDIGVSNVGFKEVRDKTSFFGEKYGLYMPGTKPTQPPSPPVSPAPPAGGSSTGTQGGNGGNLTTPPKKPKAVSSNDPASVSKKLRAFKPKGNGREKLVTLLDELKTLDIASYPHAFCFLLRSSFEISAKVYCKENRAASIKTIQKDGKDKTLMNLLRDITDFITNNGADKAKKKELHGALSELGKQNGLLSVTSMNQLVHNPNFSVIPGDICLLFHNVFPLLEEMNS